MLMNSKTGVAFSIVAVAAVVLVFASGPLVASVQAFPMHFGGFNHFGFGHRFGFNHFGFGHRFGFGGWGGWGGWGGCGGCGGCF
jgi:hypothetical protein